MEQSILLESGTGEVEVIIFKVKGSTYCVNVLKTKEIIKLNEVTPIDTSKKEILGLANIRETIMSVVDLRYVLHKESSVIEEGSMALVCEFNKQKMVFLVDEVIGIKRFRWEEINSPPDVVGSSLSVGNILDGEKILMFLDFERIVSEISAESNPYKKMKQYIHPVGEIEKEKRASKKIFLAEDSRTIRELLKEVLSEAGYDNVQVYENGEDILTALFEIKDAHGEDFRSEVDLVITDIEMPKLDGHTVTRRIKEDPILKDIPVIIFSSLITEQLFHKGESVGADLQISKPTIVELVSGIDSLLF